MAHVTIRSVKKRYGDIEPIECMGSQINQVFLNLLINASHVADEYKFFVEQAQPKRQETLPK